MNCTTCGTAFSSDSSFCANCGTPKGGTFTPPPAAEPVQPAPTYTQPSYVQPASSGTTNGMAIAGLVLSILGCTALVGAILGHVALGQIKRTGQQGRGMAIAAIAVGWSFVALSIIYGVFAALITAASSSYYY